MKRNSIIVFILTLICFSCSEQDLGDNYYYLPKYEAIDIGYPGEEAIIYKSNQQYLFSDVRIRGDVTEVKANSKFIIAKRNPLISRDNNPEVTEYYIIQKKNDSLIGPLAIEKFEEAVNSLNINLDFK